MERTRRSACRKDMALNFDTFSQFQGRVVEAHRSRPSVFSCALIAIFLAPQPSHAQDRVSVSVNDARPMAEAARVLERSLGRIITYEDPRYTHPTDVSDVTHLVRKDGGSQRVLVPSGGPFSFTYEVPLPKASSERILDLLSSVVTEYNGTGNPGAFRAVLSEGALHIVPTAVKGIDGALVAQSSLLETAISLPAQQGRTAYAAIKAVTEAVAEATGQPIIIGAAPLNALGRFRLENGATNRPARHLLLNAFEATGAPLSWQLFYDPGMKLYVLNIHVVR
jgi:hypothetical protein